MRVGDMVKDDCLVCTEETSLKKVFDLMLENKCGCIAVVESDAHKVPLGLVTEHEICLQLVKNQRDPRWLTAANVMNADIAKIKKTADTASCLKLMQRENIEQIFVVDDMGMLCGMLERPDLEACEKKKRGPVSARRTNGRKVFVRSPDSIF